MVSVFDVISKGGVMMLPVIGLSVYTLGAAVFKFNQFKKTGALEKDFVGNAIYMLRNGETAKTLESLRTQKGPVARVMETAILCLSSEGMSKEAAEAEVMRIGNAEIARLESHLRGLELTANVAPLIGLLGTVMGMIQAFASLEAAGSRIDPSVLAGGIWEALVTTASGLAVAIPALAAYYILDGLIEKIKAGMKDAAVQIFNLLGR